MKAKYSLEKQEAEIDISAQEAEDILDKIVPDSVKNAGGILSDTVRYWRWCNQINILKKVKRKIESEGLNVKKVPLRVLVPLIENSSLEEEEGMQERWANLLANAATEKCEINPNWIKILKELSPTEARILDSVYDFSKTESDYEKRKKIQYEKKKAMEIFSIPNEKADLMIENLYRLNLCQPPASHGGVSLGDYPIMVKTTDFFEFTVFGFNFVRACRWEPNNSMSISSQENSHV